MGASYCHKLNEPRRSNSCDIVFYKIDEIITVPGILTPAEGGVEIKSPIGGKIKRINVEEGDIIKKNDLLIQYDVKSELKKKETYERNRTGNEEFRAEAKGQ